MNLVGQGSIYVVLTVKHFWAALKAVTSWNVEEKWKVMKMKNMIKEIGKMLLVGVVTISPFALHVLGVI